MSCCHSLRLSLLSRCSTESSSYIHSSLLSLTLSGKRCQAHLRQDIRKAKNPRCLSCTIQNLPPQYRGVWYPSQAALLSYSCTGGTSQRQLAGLIVAHDVERHRDIPKFCVRIIFDKYHVWCVYRTDFGPSLDYSKSVASLLSLACTSRPLQLMYLKQNFYCARKRPRRKALESCT